MAAGDFGGFFFALLVPGLLSLAVLPWAYERKYLSDRSFQLAFLWIVFAAAYGAQSGTARSWGYGAASVAVYAVLTALMLPRLRRAGTSRAVCSSCAYSTSREGARAGSSTSATAGAWSGRFT